MTSFVKTLGDQITPHLQSPKGMKFITIMIPFFVHVDNVLRKKTYSDWKDHTKQFQNALGTNYMSDNYKFKCCNSLINIKKVI